MDKKDLVLVLVEKVAHLQKREARLTREAQADRRRIKRTEHHLKQLTDAVRRGLPHMNLTPFLDDDIEEEEING